MSECVVGSFLLDGPNDISFQKGEYRFVGNEMGGLLVDTQTKQSPQVWGKETIWLLDKEGALVRKRNLDLNEPVTVVMAEKEGKNPVVVGEITFVRE